MHLILTAHKVIVVNVIATGIVGRDKLIAVDRLCAIAGGVDSGDLGVLGEREQVVDQAVGGLRAQGTGRRGVDEGAHELGRDLLGVVEALGGGVGDGLGGHRGRHVPAGPLEEGVLEGVVGHNAHLAHYWICQELFVNNHYLNLYSNLQQYYITVNLR